MWPFSRTKKQADNSTDEQRSIEDPAVGLGSAEAWESVFGEELGGAAGQVVTRETALSVPAVWAAVNVLSSTIASLPLGVYRRGAEDERESLAGTSIHSRLNYAPNKRWTSYRWRKHVMQSVLLSGRSYTWIDRPSPGNVRALWPLDPDFVEPYINGDDELVYRYTGGRTPIEYSAENIIDIPWMLKPDGITHITPISKLKRTIGLTLALEKYGTDYFESGGVPPLKLTGPIKSSGAAQRAAEEVWRRLLGRKNQNVLVLPDGHDLAPVGFDPEKNQLTESRRFQLEEVARVFDVSPVFLQDLTHGTYSNTEQQDLHFVKHTVSQWVNSIEQELNLKLFGVGGRRYCEFNLDGLLRGDFVSRMNGYAQAAQNSIMTPNEIRRRENMEPKEGGESLMVQQNMSELNRLGEAQDTQPAGTNNDE